MPDTNAPRILDQNILDAQTRAAAAATADTPPDGAVAPKAMDTNGQQLPPGAAAPAAPAAATAPTPGTTPSPTMGETAVDPKGGVTRNVGSDELVQDRIDKLLERGSPLLEQARERAKAAASRRGLVNSSLAVQGGEEAALNAALPIATADAGTTARQNLANLDITNQALQSEAERRSRESMNAAQVGAQANETASRERIAGSDISARERIASESFTNALNIAGLDQATRTHIAQMNIDASAQQQLAGLSQNTLANYGNAVATILSNPNMSTDDKDTAIRNLTAIYAGSPYLPVHINWGATPTPTPAGSNPAGRINLGG